ncbi:MAG TPA: peptidase M23 [Gammaproteobacteria bacterium]|nr:peptidase M23 [Gammaproteobacteria bacterium]
MSHDTRIRFDYSPAITTVTARPVRWRLLPLMMFPLLGGALVYGLTQNPLMHTARESAAPATDAPDLASLPGEKLDVIVQRHDTLDRIFRQFKLDQTDLAAILGLPGARQALSQIRPGDKLTLVHEDGTVHALNRRISETEILSVTRADSGFAAEIITTPVEFRATHAYGTIDSSLFVAARAAGVNPETILQLANDIFGWEIDFVLDIRTGDRFHLVYEQKFRDGQYLGDARILAAEFVNAGERHHAVHYASADGQIDGYFTPDGRSMRRQFLRAPLDFRRVSSNFNPNRRHPILNSIRAHQGVDYAAPTGTSIKASGDGRVSFAGVKGGYGKVITLEHGGGISTLYGHLSGFARGLRPGQRVKQGDTIGYVGSTGAATGPHLHYEYRVNGIHRNPRTVRLPDAAPIPADYLVDFQSKAAALIAQLEQGRGTAVATSEDGQGRR